MLKLFKNTVAAAARTQQSWRHINQLSHSDRFLYLPIKRPNAWQSNLYRAFSNFAESNASSEQTEIKDHAAVRVSEEVEKAVFDVQAQRAFGARKKPLFTSVTSLSQLTQEDINTYVNISKEDFAKTLGECLPAGLAKEYEETKGTGLLVRLSFLEIRDYLKAYVEESVVLNSQCKPRKHFILDGPVSSGKSITLAMLVHWARSEGWFVFYVPKASTWTRGGFHFKNPVASSWDTPVQAETILGTLLKSHESLLQTLPCRIFEPIVLGEAPGVGMMKDAEAVAMPEGCTLLDLVQTGLACTHAAVGVVVRVREELSLVKEVPVLFAIDEYNSWFTFSQYIEHKTKLSKRSIHARELTMVKPFRSMLHNDMMVVAYSHSTGVGRLREHLPDTPLGVRYDFPRYSFREAETVANYYYRQSLISQDRFDENKWKRIFYLTSGNGTEMRNLLHFI